MMLLAFLFAALSVVVAVAPVAAQKDVDESSICPTTQTSGSGDKLFSTCVTDTGQVGKFITPSGVGNLNAEAYMICDAQSSGPAAARAWSSVINGFAESNFLAPTTHTATANVRKTGDNRYVLTQSYARDTVERQLVVTMTLKNLGPGSVTNVMLMRAADMDAGGSSTNVFLAGEDAIVAMNPSNGRGMIMGAVSTEISHDTFVETYTNFNSAPDRDDCNPETPVATPTSPGDYVGILRFNLGTIAQGAAKTVKMFYQRF